MRMEEISENRYNKSTDQVERYLLGLIEQYFKTNDIADPASKEYIIRKSVERLKEEVNFDAIGVLSISLPNDTEPRTGAVTISLEELGGEPLISPKLSAFNVNFGQEKNTACEGNDPRLSDKRVPINHRHEIDEVIGLETRLHTIEELIKKGQVESHTHKNKDVLDKIIYTGSKKYIDLTILDTIEETIRLLVEQIKKDIVTYTNEVNQRADEVNKHIDDITIEIQNIKTYIDQQNEIYLNKSKNYTNTKITELETEINNKLTNYVKKEKIVPLVDIASRAYTKLGTQSFNLIDYINSGEDIVLDSQYKNILDSRGLTFSDCVVDIFVKGSMSGKNFYYQTPYSIFNDGNLVGIIDAAYTNDGIIRVFANSNTDESILSYFTSLTLIVNIYATETISI